jgi:ATP-dependent helicase HrpA
MGDAMADVGALATELATRVRPEDGPMLPVLARALKELTGVAVAPEAFDLGELSPHLRFFVRVVDGARRLGEGRDVTELQERFGARSRAARGALAQP